MATGPHPASDPFPHAAVKQQREGVPRVPGPGNPLAQPEPGAAAWPNSVAARYAANLTQSRRQHPSTERILEIFASLARHDLYQHSQHVQTFQPELTALQLQVLDLLGLPSTAYSDTP